MALATAWVGSLAWAYRLGRRKDQKDFQNQVLQNRYRLVYAPLRTLLLDKHITTVVGVHYPRVLQRIRRAWPYLRRFNLKYGFKILSDKYGKPRSEIEFGGHFPLKQIKEIIEKHGEWADSKLLGLVQKADRSKYESYDEYEFSLTEEELTLADHIWDMYDQLNKRFSFK